jgi:hydroxymethylpyrimidine pyrophosphatase-like HAD family hydrolase
MYIFDLDGVLTNPETNKVNQAVLKRIAGYLADGQKVAFNTGRPHEWVQEHVLTPLEAQVPAEARSNLLVVAEMGSVLGRYKNGTLDIAFDPTVALPHAFTKDFIKLLDKPLKSGRYADYVWRDDQKKTMATMVKHEYIPLKVFDDIRPLLTKELQTLMAAHDLSDFVLAQATSATDIQHRTVGKHKGAQEIKKWLAEHKLAPKGFHAFGDSVGDKAMAEEFSKEAPTIFVFVGSPNAAPDVIDDKRYTTVITGGKFDQDTARYLADQ